MNEDEEAEDDDIGKAAKKFKKLRKKGKHGLKTGII